MRKLWRSGRCGVTTEWAGSYQPLERAVKPKLLLTACSSVDVLVIDHVNGPPEN
jgi:hypothetical protein